MQKIIITGKLKNVTKEEVNESLIINFDVIADNNSGGIDELPNHYSCIFKQQLNDKKNINVTNTFSQYLQTNRRIIVEGYPKAIIIKDEIGQPQAHIQIVAIYCELVGVY
jgi:hypothetical protein